MRRRCTLRRAALAFLVHGATAQDPLAGFGGGDAYGASGTSFYTTTEKQDSYDSHDKVLNAKCKDEGVRKVIVEMLDACGEITEALRSALVTVCVKINFRGAL